MQTQSIDYQDQDLVLKGFYAFDEAIGNPTQKPVVLVCHDWTGCNDFAREKAKKIAELGYLGFAVDMYGNGKQGATKEEKTALMSPLMNDRKRLRKRIQAGLIAAKALEIADKKKVAAIGFCFGGLCVLDLARSGVDLCGAVSFHGLLSAPEGLLSEAIKAKVLVLHGYDDPMAGPESVNNFAEEMTKAKVDWQVHWYGQTMHAFTNPQADDPAFGTVYDADADRRSWQAMKNFLEEILK